MKGPSAAPFDDDSEDEENMDPPAMALPVGDIV